MAEVEWLTSVLTKEWAALGVVRPAVLDDESARTLIQELVEFPARDGSPLTVQAAILPSATTRFVELLRRLDSACSVQSHAGNGIVRVRFSDELKTASTKSVLRRLQRLSRRSGGNVVVLSAQAMGDAGDFAGGQERALLDMMRVVKREFDPKNLLNPGRLVFR
jgi:FAD/FMN-containing dehydrogenase